MTDSTEQGISIYETSVGKPRLLSAVLDTGADAQTVAGAMTTIEVWINNHEVGLVVFNVYGSRNQVDWRLTQSLNVVAGEFKVGFSNAYRHIKVEPAAAGEYEIEIAGSR